MGREENWRLWINSIEQFTFEQNQKYIIEL